MKYSTKRILPVSSGEGKGQRTWEWELQGRPVHGHYITVFSRKQGEHIGEHFHKGEDPSKNPERILLLSGCMNAWFTFLDGSREETVLDAAAGPLELVIPAWVLHGMEVEQDCWYILYQQSKFDPTNPDTYSPEEFRVP